MGWLHYSSHGFHHKIDETLKVVKRILEQNKNPTQLAANVDHQYEDKYALIEFMVNTGIAATLNVLEQLDGFHEEDTLKQVIDVVQNQHRSMTLRFTCEEACEFVEETIRTVESPMSHKYTIQKTKTDPTTGTTTEDNVYSHKIVNEVKEFHWNIGKFVSDDMCGYVCVCASFVSFDTDIFILSRPSLSLFLFLLL